MASSLVSKMIKAVGKGTHVDVLKDSSYFDKGPLFKSNVPVINLMFSGDFSGAISYGTTMFVGDSRTYKSNFCLKIVSEFMAKYPDSICIFVDTEFGASSAYFGTFNIDTERVVHVPITNIEQMSFQLNQMLDEVTDGEKVIVFIDSISQAASKKEAVDALDGNSVTDMTRAKSLNSFWRVINPIINLKKIPLLAINSYYDSITDKYAEKQIKGGKQGFLSSDNIFFITRSKERDEDKDLMGFTFNYKALKSRFVRENSVFPLRVTFEGGIDKYSGMFELMKEGGFIEMPINGWYNLGDISGLPKLASNVRKAEATTSMFLERILATRQFKDYAYKTYSLAAIGIDPNSTKPGNPTATDLADKETGEIPS